ncbi:hypothetical protein Hanom_Chr06g00565651 [Helianthus anomalus]
MIRVRQLYHLAIRPCVVVKNYNAPTMGHYSTRVIPVSMGHYSIKWCSGEEL